MSSSYYLDSPKGAGSQPDRPTPRGSEHDNRSGHSGVNVVPSGNSANAFRDGIAVRYEGSPLSGSVPFAQSAPPPPLLPHAETYGSLAFAPHGPQQYTSTVTTSSASTGGYHQVQSRSGGIPYRYPGMGAPPPPTIVPNPHSGIPRSPPAPLPRNAPSPFNPQPQPHHYMGNDRMGDSTKGRDDEHGEEVGFNFPQNALPFFRGTHAVMSGDWNAKGDRQSGGGDAPMVTMGLVYNPEGGERRNGGTAPIGLGSGLFVPMGNTTTTTPPMVPSLNYQSSLDPLASPPLDANVIPEFEWDNNNDDDASDLEDDEETVGIHADGEAIHSAADDAVDSADPLGATALSSLIVGDVGMPSGMGLGRSPHLSASSFLPRASQSASRDASDRPSRMDPVGAPLGGVALPLSSPLQQLSSPSASGPHPREGSAYRRFLRQKTESGAVSGMGKQGSRTLLRRNSSSMLNDTNSVGYEHYLNYNNVNGSRPATPQLLVQPPSAGQQSAFSLSSPAAIAGGDARYAFPTLDESGVPFSHSRSISRSMSGAGGAMLSSVSNSFSLSQQQPPSIMREQQDSSEFVQYPEPTLTGRRVKRAWRYGLFSFNLDACVEGCCCQICQLLRQSLYLHRMGQVFSFDLVCFLLTCCMFCCPILCMLECCAGCWPVNCLCAAVVRTRVRQRYNIEGSQLWDCTVSFCTCCVVSQMFQEMVSMDDYPGSCIGSDPVPPMAFQPPSNNVIQ